MRCLMIRFKDLPVYWRVKKPQVQPDNDVPCFLDISLEIDEQTSLVRQRLTNARIAVLDAMYRKNANIGYARKGNDLGLKYGSDFFQFATSLLGIPNGRSLLEIGCGECVLLEEFRKLNWSVSGIDPSPISKTAADEKQIDLVNDFFPSAALAGKYDVVVSMNVLEHIYDPIGWLNSCREILSSEGLLFCAVPDVTECLNLSEPSFLMHQHISYFDATSLKKLALSAGFESATVFEAGYGGSIYLVAGLSQCAPVKGAYSVAGEANVPKNFSESLHAHRTKVVNEIHEWRSAGKSVGIYCPQRFLPYIDSQTDLCGIRFFDDTPHWRGCQFDGVDVIIESFEEFASSPPTVILIMSLTFGSFIKNKIFESGYKGSVYLLEELLLHDAP